MLSLNMVSRHCGDAASSVVWGLLLAFNTKVLKRPSSVIAASWRWTYPCSLHISFVPSRNKHVSIVHTAIMMQSDKFVSAFANVNTVRSIAQGRNVALPLRLDPIPHLIAVA